MTTTRSMQATLPARLLRSNFLHHVSINITLSDGRVVTNQDQFRTGLQRFGGSKWISGGTLLRRNISASELSKSNSKLINATAYASGVGCFAIKIDGVLISNSFMDPGWATLPSLHVSYRAYDVSAFFRDAADDHAPSPPQRIEVSLGMCKYGYQNSFCIGGNGVTDVCKAFLMSLQLTYEDGTTFIIETSASDGRWEATTNGNPIRYSHLYHGEQYDGRVVGKGNWRPATLATFNTGESDMQQPVSAEKALGTLSMLPETLALQSSKTYSPISIHRIQSNSNGGWVFDMSNNMAGFATLSVPRSALSTNGSPVILKYGEVLNKDGTVNMAFGKMPCSTINCANQTDTFIPIPTTIKKEQEDDIVTYTPSFTYHGFRYIQIEGLNIEYTPKASDLTAIFLHSNVRQTGNVSFPLKFNLLNQIQASIVQTQLSNLHFHPTDCPQREKRGWTGDGQLTSRQASLNFDMVHMYDHWLQTMVDHDTVGCVVDHSNATHFPIFPQANVDVCCDPKLGPKFGCDYTGIPNGTFSNTLGSVADVIPFMNVGAWPGDPTWGAISTVLPYVVWKYGGDDSLVNKFYLASKKNVDFFLRETSATENGLIEFGYYGDWCSIAKIGKPQVTATTQIMVLSNLVEMAQHLGKTSDVTLYNNTLLNARKAYHAKYWNVTLKSYIGGTQTANLVPLMLNIPPTAEERTATASTFVADVMANGNASTSGIVGAGYVLQALVLAGRGDVALSMALKDTYPSWGYMLKQGPGTIWETWDDSTNSHNHPMFTASIGPYLYCIVGLNPLEWKIGEYLNRGDEEVVVVEEDEKEKEEDVTIHIKPDVHAVRILQQASGRVNTQCGEVAVSWSARSSSSSSSSSSTMHSSRSNNYFEMNVTIPQNCGRARVEIPTEDVINIDDDLCINGERVVRRRRNVNRKTVDVFVNGGHTKVYVSRCQ